MEEDYSEKFSEEAILLCKQVRDCTVCGGEGEGVVNGCVGRGRVWWMGVWGGGGYVSVRGGGGCVSVRGGCVGVRGVGGCVGVRGGGGHVGVRGGGGCVGVRGGEGMCV